jgi:hypothetical protein
MTNAPYGLFNRKCSLQVTRQNGTGLDLSNFRIVFSVEASDEQHPNTAVIRVYNLSLETVNLIRKEFQYVFLQAGYDPNPFAAIFIGSIKQYRIGKENATTSYLDLLCADSDVAYNAAVIAESFAAGNTPAQTVQACIVAMNAANTRANPANPPPPITFVPGGELNSNVTGIAAPRGKVLFGSPKNAVRSTAANLGVSWSFQNGQLQFIPYNSYLPNEPVVLSQFSGIVGIPEATNEGIKIKCLLNPLIRIGGLVQIDASLINQIVAALGNIVSPTVASGGSAGVAYNSYGDISFYAKTYYNGKYRVYVAEYEGDTRGQKWYTTLTCLAVDPSSGTVITNPFGN